MPHNLRTARGGKPTIDGCLVTVEQVCQFTAARLNWTYTETMQTPAWHVWQMWRTTIDADEQTRQNRKGR